MTRTVRHPGFKSPQISSLAPTCLLILLKSACIALAFLSRRLSGLAVNIVPSCAQNNGFVEASDPVAVHIAPAAKLELALGEELEQAYGSSYVRGQEDAVLAVPHWAATELVLLNHDLSVFQQRGKFSPTPESIKGRFCS